MPIYEYQCTKCGHGLEAIQKFSDNPLTTCPACNKEALKKKVSAPSFRLSGGGWYETDFKTGKQKNLAGEGSQSDGAAKASDAGSDKTSTSSGESKKSSDAPGKTTAA